jgi:hypothetical protein
MVTAALIFFADCKIDRQYSRTQHSMDFMISCGKRPTKMALIKVSIGYMLLDLAYLKNYRTFESHKDYFIEHILSCVQEYYDCIPMNFLGRV